MAQNKSYKELMELQGKTGGTGQSTGAGSSNQMLDLILNRQPFQYNAQTDPAAQAARKTAARNAQAVTRDTMGQHAAMTGGMPSTAAVSAAAQAGNAALQEGTDRVAELEQLAFQNYQTEGQNMYNAYAALQQSEGDAFNRQMQEQQWQYQQEQDAKAADEAEYQKKLALAQLKASYGDLSGLKELGVDTSKYLSGGGYSGGGGGGGYQSSTRNPGSNDKKPAGGLDTAAKNELTILAYDNGGSIPADVWASYAAKYGEAALIAAGFKKKAQQSNPTPGSGSNSSGGGQKPGLPGLLHPGIAKGESELGTRN